MKLLRSVTLAAAAVLFTTSAYAQARAQPTVILLRHATLLDGVRNQPQRNVAIVIRNGRISSIHPDDARPSSGADSVIEVHGAWVTPGLIDAHAHVGFVDAPDSVTMKRALEGGVTTIRSMAFIPQYGDVALKHRFLTGTARVPRVLAASRPVIPVVGEEWLRDLPTLRPLLRPATGEDSALKLEPGRSWRLRGNDAAIDSAVGVLKAHGVDWIKVFATGRAGLASSNPSTPFLSEREMHLAVIAARKRGLPVAAHALTDAGARAAVLAGVRTLEHGPFASAATLRLMMQKGTCYVPTLMAWKRHALDPDSLMRARGAVLGAAGRNAVSLAHSLGVVVIAGTDNAYGARSPRVADEVAALARAGLSPDEALRAATSQSARCLGLAKEVGSVTPGRSADLLVIDRDPREDLMRLDNPMLVIVAGRVLVDRRSARK